VGALRTKAEPNGDGTYAITGQKIYISWGDTTSPRTSATWCWRACPMAPGHQGDQPVPGAQALPDADGNPGVANSLKVVSLEHKMGLHGSPTCVMEYDGATGWLVGPPHGGMAAMFTMMNNARLGVGTQGVGVAEAAYQHALAYAPTASRAAAARGGTGTILDHADVRRMLMTMKAETFAARAIALMTARWPSTWHRHGRRRTGPRAPPS
jgi:acyl-CoA dehydrogenase